ncbi:MAG: hypothetical protein J07HB67_01232 [halophilic archaeon J07HB67]|jgi:hypothetical protein|nr:MAG: hypothetical protein J07HB67_01232 [halophilic archaeon J07HB67]
MMTETLSTTAALSHVEPLVRLARQSPSAVALQLGGSTAERAFGLALLAAFLASLALSLFVSLRVLRGYRRSGQRRLLLFGVGVLCIVFLSKVTSVVLSPAVGLGLGIGVTSVVATGWRIVGAVLVLNAIYDR